MLVFTASTACYPEHTKWIRLRSLQLRRAGLELGEAVMDLILYPNPGDGTDVNVRYPVREKSSTLKVINSHGVLVQQWQLAAGQSRFKLPINQLPNGIYFLHWSYGTDRLVKKLVISH
jgi:hypothetical protein